jgi:ectoine hydroxylase-related dioxygenase (phytanoyl-CoA dioxygenase family)
VIPLEATVTRALDVPRVLDDKEVDQFWDQGYLLVRGVLSRDEAEHYRRVITDLIPRDLSIPPHWHVADGRIKPMRTEHDQTYDIPELLPLFGNERLYAVAAQLLESPRLRVFDGSLGVTLRNDASRDRALSQTLHIDASVPATRDNFLFSLEEVQLGGCFYFTDVLPDGGGIHVVPGGHRRVEEEARADAMGRHLHTDWKRITHMDSVEVTGEAGDFALVHHLMPHGASHNRRTQARVAQFQRYVRTDHPHGVGEPDDPARYNDLQLAAMSSLTRQLLGIDPW